MKTNALVAELHERFGQDIQGVYRRHGVRFGGERELRGLCEVLARRPGFRSDLFALCSSISHMAECDVPSYELGALVARSYGEEMTMDHGTAAEFAEAYAAWTDGRAAMREAQERDATVITAGQAEDPPVMNEVDETLQRLSVSSLELKMFLADVRQRVSEMDPEVEHLERMVAQMKGSPRTVVERPSPAADAEFSKAPVGPLPVATELVEERRANGAAATVRRLRWIAGVLAAALLLTLGLGAGWMVWGRGTGLGDAETAAAGVTTGGALGSVAAKPSAVVAAEPTTGEAVARGMVARTTGGLVTKSVERPARPVQRVLAARSDGVERAIGGARAGGGLARVPAPIERVDPDARARAAGPVFVPSSTMIGYALATPKPLYPAVSVPDDKEGRVEVKATISAEGEVVATQVLSGPVVFRDAADRAMQRWRFRPYVVDGKAVEVSTTVAFVFRSQPAT